MSVESGNATTPTPAIAPGAEDVDARRVAERLGRMCAETGHVDPRIPRWVAGFDAPFFQAGLAGYSDAAMRLIARRHGCPFCVTEALLDRTLLAGGRGFAKADLGELEDNVPGGAEDAPLACQIMGSDPAEMAAAALKAIEQGSRGERAYRRLAYREGGVFPDAAHLRLPGGEQLGRIDVRAQLEVERAASRDPGPVTATDDVLDIASCEDLSCGDLVEETCLDRSSTVGDHEGPVSAAREAPTSGLSSSLSFATIDVNLACPVKKISKKARGGHWLAEPEGAIALLEAVRESVPERVPCTVKLRRAFDDTPEMVENFHRILAAAMDMGYVWATVHARTVEQKYVGPSRWDLLRQLVARERTRAERMGRQPPVIFGSGDIWHAADIFRMVAYTGVHAAAVARGCIGNPWIFRQARDMMAGRAPAPPTMAEQRAVLEEHFRLALAVNAGVRRAEVFTGKTMRKFAIRFAAHHPRADEVRRAFIAVDSLEAWRFVLDTWYH